MPPEVLSQTTELMSHETESDAGVVAGKTAVPDDTTIEKAPPKQYA